MSDWPTAMRVNAFCRVVEAAGGQAMILARGDRESGVVLLITLDRESRPKLFERERDWEGASRIVQRKADMVSETELTDYWQGRRRNDPDLWVVEAVVADGERLGAQTLWAD